MTCMLGWFFTPVGKLLIKATDTSRVQPYPRHSAALMPKTAEWAHGRFMYELPKGQKTPNGATWIKLIYEDLPSVQTVVTARRIRQPGTAYASMKFIFI